MSQSRKPLRLSALRLVGFHNFHDQLIPIRGDLFTVGSNESGKTTILDALHMVLTGDQQVDLNAAASVVATREPARKIQGIILRADMAGRPRKKGGITYVAAELAEANSSRPPYTLVLGMYAADMNSRVRRWGLICRTPAAELSLTQPADDGRLRVVDDRELEEQLGQPIWRQMGKYRAAVAQLLLDNSDQFDAILDLWRKAKSYRELARTSRDPASVIRQVLPAPDQQAFENVAKSLADVAEWEVQLNELRRDVEALSQLEDKLRSARDARETYRRYTYVDAWHHADRARGEVQALEDKLEKQRKSHGDVTRQLQDCQNEITDADKSLGELRASQGMQLVEQVKALEARLAGSATRLEDRREALSQLKHRNEQLTKRKEQDRQTLDASLANAAQVLDEAHAVLCEPMPQMAQAARNVHNALPESVDTGFDAEAILQHVKQFEKWADDCTTQLQQKDSESEKALSELVTQRDDRGKALDRLRQHEDLVPELPGLDAALAELQRGGIPYRLLYQTLEFPDGVSDDQTAAVEAALGIERLATIIVPPAMALQAREAVEGLRVGLRVLEAQRAPTIAPGISVLVDRLLDRLIIDDIRVEAHLRAVANEMALLDHVPDEGTSLAWWMTDGRSGDPGARRAGEFPPAQWIGGQQRRRRREVRIVEIQSQLENLKSQIAGVQEQRRQFGRIQQHVQQSREMVGNLNLPWAIQSIHQNLISLDGQLKNLRLDVQRTSKACDDEQREHDRLMRHLTQARQQAQAANANILLEQIKELENALGVLRKRKEALDRTAGTFEERVTGLERNLDDAKKAVEPAERKLVEVADALLALLDGVDRDTLHHHVFTEKRASQIRPHNLQELIKTAVGKESEAMAQLRSSDGVMNALLAQRYGFRIDDRDDRLDILDPKDQTLAALLDQRQGELAKAAEALGPRTQELFQRVLGTELIGKLRENLTDLRRRQRELNSVLESLVFGHSRFQLHHTLVDDFKRFVELLESASLTNNTARDELVHYIRERKDAFDSEGNVPGFLDYRNWFDFSLRLRHVSNETAGVVGSEDMVRGSGGAQGTHIYLLLFAMATLLFNRCGARLRLLMLDEAFYGVDPQRKELLLRCGKQLNLDFAIATPDLDGTITEDGGDSTTVLVEKDADDEVDVVPFVWEHRQPQQELFAVPRPDAVIPGADGEST